MIGSEKQIKSAREIKENAYKEMEKSFPNPSPGGYAKIEKVLELEESAEWWINHRGLFFKKIVNEIAKNHPEAKEILK